MLVAASIDMKRVSMTFSKLHVLALVLAIGAGCGSNANGDPDKAGAPVSGGTTGGSGGGKLPNTGGSGAVAGASGSGGRTIVGQAGKGDGGAGAGGVSPGSGGSKAVDGGMLAGCVMGERLIPEGTSVPAADGCNTCSCQGGSLACTEIACAPQCIVARHLDTCCATYDAVPLSALATDECLVRHPSNAIDAALVQRCLPTNCPAVLCAPEVLPSRVAMDDGKGGCRYSDECQKDQDCVIASNSTACCGCPESIPASLLAGNQCLVAQLSQDAQAIRVNLCPTCSMPVQCGACVPPPAKATCLIRDSFSVCQ